MTCTHNAFTFMLLCLDPFDNYRKTHHIINVVHEHGICTTTVSLPGTVYPRGGSQGYRLVHGAFWKSETGFLTQVPLKALEQAVMEGTLQST